MARGIKQSAAVLRAQMLGIASQAWQPAPGKFSHNEAMVEFIEGPFSTALLESIREAVALLCQQQYADLFSYVFMPPSGISSLFGPDWPGHALRHQPVFWHRPLTEADITKLTVATLQDDMPSARAFLRALYQASELPKDEVEKFLPSGTDITIRAEDTSQENKRIDILFEWGRAKTARVVVLEVKFGASADNPFASYEKLAKSRLKERTGGDLQNNINYFFVIQHASSERDVTDKENFTRNANPWRIVYWQDLLKLWEAHLKQCHVTSIPNSTGASVRHSIFNKVYGGV
ncbi:MAG: hypothetical protein BCS36_00185 [Desulfovibrio sp. MES5]|uniref:PD-(D/E)XK nuclease family protein n=1 Tax=Desulfovibrio sp. MES5 TaxID=1899016 RepID=UPI000B9CAD1E|nr:PD-(D/E)XK nuclease family protein [Desulfovibrio sp. MES5]OXS29335.1 MAG: hypothetical protein BCS36_00185 [Desulfovibrio sp. MES5]